MIIHVLHCLLACEVYIRSHCREASGRKLMMEETYESNFAVDKWTPKEDASSSPAMQDQRGILGDLHAALAEK